MGVCSYCLLDSITPTPNLFGEMDIAHNYLYFSDFKMGLNMFSTRCPKCQEQWHWIARLHNCTCSHQLLTSFMFLLFVKSGHFQDPRIASNLIQSANMLSQVSAQWHWKAPLRMLRPARDRVVGVSVQRWPQTRPRTAPQLSDGSQPDKRKTCPL